MFFSDGYFIVVYRNSSISADLRLGYHHQAVKFVRQHRNLVGDGYLKPVIALGLSFTLGKTLCLEVIFAHVSQAQLDRNEASSSL